jgi:hypothetical protein
VLAEWSHSGWHEFPERCAELVRTEQAAQAERIRQDDLEEAAAEEWQERLEELAEEADLAAEFGRIKEWKLEHWQMEHWEGVHDAGLKRAIPPAGGHLCDHDGVMGRRNTRLCHFWSGRQCHHLACQDSRRHGQGRA